MKRRFFSFILFFSGVTLCLSGPVNNPSFKSSTTTAFIENKGQIIDQNNQPNPGVLYLLNTPGFNVQLRRGGFSYDLYRISNPDSYRDDQRFLKSDRKSKIVDQCSIFKSNQRYTSNDSNSVISFHRIDLDLLNANPNPVIETSEPAPDYFNYFTANAPPAGIKNVRQYARITYKNIYSNIDLEFFTNEQHGYKYNFVIHPGANINDIRLKIDGPDNISLNQDTLKFGTRFGDVEELIPESYYYVNESKVDIPARFISIDLNIYGFSSDKIIPKNSTLVIDPTAIRLWGTYYGGSGWEGGEGCTTDKAGNVFLAGTTDSPNNIASSGAYQGTLAGSEDGFLAKFNAAGQRQWGTYFGGTLLEDGISCVVDKSENIYVGGDTKSTSGIASAGAHQTVYGGGAFDCYIEKFNQAGDRLWGTYYGGAASDAGGWICTDKNGNVFITGMTSSDTGIATPGSYQPNRNASTDAFIAKFDNNGVRQWGSYYGGESSDNGEGCTTDGSGNVYLAGGTQSLTNIASPGAFQTTLGGSSDAFLVKFTSGGQRLWATYYGGSLEDQGYICASDSAGNVCFVGRTKSPNGIASPGCHQPVYGGGIYDGYIVKFDSSGQRQWGTYYGGTGDEQAMSCTFGWNGDVFMGGWTTSTNNISTPDSYQPVLDGVSDAYFVKFNAAGQRQWGSYYGGYSGESFYACTYVVDDTLYMSGLTVSSDNIASPGAWQTVYGGAQDDILIKFLECWTIDTAGPIMGPMTGCIPSTGVNYEIPSLAHAINYIWMLPPGVTISSGAGTSSIFVDISPTASSGTISVRGVNKCGDFGYPAYLYVPVQPRPVPVISGPAIPCAGPGNIYSTASGQMNYQWSTSAGGVITSGGTSADNTATVTWNTAGTQHVYVNYTDINGCDALTPTVFNVTVTPSPVVNVTISASSNNVCQGTQVTFTATPINGGTTPFYQWKINGANAGSNSSTYAYNPASGDLVSCILTSSISGCILNNPDTSNTITMTVNPILPVSVSITASENPFCQGTTIIFTANPTNEGTTPSYQWKVNGGNVGGNNPVYSYIPNNGDVVSCILNSSIACPTGNPATSNTITMIENTNVVVSVTISPSLNPVCSGTSVTVQAIPTNGGTTPVYQWKVNGIIVGANNPVYSYVPINGDVIVCILTSNAACASGNPATSNTITMAVNPNLPVIITISPSENPVCAGTTVNFTSNTTNGGNNPAYQWKVNGINVGTNNPAYSYIPASGDIVKCILTSDAICPTGNPATSNQIIMTVNPNLPVSVSITASNNPVCSGIAVIYTAIPANGGSSPSYQWKVNGINVGTNSSSYSYNPVSGDLVSCILTSNAICPTGNPATSNTITMNVPTSPIVTLTRCNDSITTTNAKPFKLKGGIPLGGTYSGAGVAGGIYHPAIAGVGTHQITYTYTNAALCSANAIVPIVTIVPAVTNCGNPVTDIRDNKVYQTVKIGNQCWLVEDLNYGIEIPANVVQRDNCIAEKYHNPASSIQHPASVYQWDEIMQYDEIVSNQGLCPPAWHVPTEADWNTLFTNYINNGFAGSPLKYSGFSGFNALLSGARHLNTIWDYSGFATFFWSSTTHGTNKAWAHAMNDTDPSVAAYPSYRSNAFSVRCVKD